MTLMTYRHSIFSNRQVEGQGSLVSGEGFIENLPDFGAAGVLLDAAHRFGHCIGWKPATWGSVATAGIILLSYRLDCIGIHVKSQ